MPSITGWFQYCKIHGFVPNSPSIAEVITYMTRKFHEGLSYGSLNSLRSALALVIGTHIGTDARIKRLFKGFFRLRPNKPKYNYTWDVSTVLNHIEHNYLDLNSLEQNARKTVTLLALTTGHRAQTIASIQIDNIIVAIDRIHIKISDIIKTSGPNRNQPFIVLPYFKERPNICPARSLINYISITKLIRNNRKKLFLSYKKPHNEVSTNTISRWIKIMLEESGIDTSVFSAHSTRHASTSAARMRGVSIDEIRRTAGWTGSSTSFGRFYNRPVSNDSVSFAEAIININQE